MVIHNVPIDILMIPNMWKISDATFCKKEKNKSN